MQCIHKEWIIIGISGVTCGGKTSLARRLEETLSPVRVLHQDQYFYPDDSPHHVRCAGLPHNNYDILGAVDMPAMMRDIRRTLDGSAPLDPAPHAPHAPHAQRFSIPGKKFLIAEGFTVLNYKPIMDMCHFRYYFVLSYEQCLARRVFRLYEPADVPGYFEQCVWPEHLKYRAEIEKDHRVKIVDGMLSNTLDLVMEDLRSLTSDHHSSPPSSPSPISPPQ